MTDGRSEMAFASASRPSEASSTTHAAIRRNCAYIRRVSSSRSTSSASSGSEPCGLARFVMTIVLTRMTEWTG
jgi:hypothetical protein